MLTITSRVESDNSHQIIHEDLMKDDISGKLLPVYKKIVVIMARVHPGESNTSFMMQGFIKFITSNY